jgi:hypothetical protein
MGDFKRKKNQDLSKALDRLYKCRDLEISNLWQRSVFLSVFLILSFTGYGKLMLEIIDEENYSKILKYNLVVELLSSVGLLFSLVWILMAKSSKAWFEVYETAVYEFENEYQEKLNLPSNYIMGEIKLEKKKINNFIFSTKAGSYSPSKINILIGQISLVIWFSILLFHSIYNYIQIECITNNDKNLLTLTIIIPILALFSGFYIVYSEKVRSTFLGK